MSSSSSKILAHILRAASAPFSFDVAFAAVVVIMTAISFPHDRLVFALVATCNRAANFSAATAGLISIAGVEKVSRQRLLERELQIIDGRAPFAVCIANWDIVAAIAVVHC